MNDTPILFNEQKGQCCILPDMMVQSTKCSSTGPPFYHQAVEHLSTPKKESSQYLQQISQQKTVPKEKGKDRPGRMRQWTKQEDERLQDLVRMFKGKNWSKMAELMPSRCGKQCRERWVNHLNPGINKAHWTEKEDLTIITAHQKYGSKWSTIAKFLKGRTDNQIKNHFNSTITRKIKFQQGQLLKRPPQKKIRRIRQAIFPCFSAQDIEAIHQNCNPAETIATINRLLNYSPFDLYQ